MTKRTVNVAVLVAVLTVAVLAPSTTFAAPTVRTTQIASPTGISMLDMILSMFGFNPVSGSRSTPTQGQMKSGGSSSASISTEEAIWGGGKCRYAC